MTVTTHSYPVVVLFALLVVCLVLFVLLPVVHATVSALFTTFVVGLLLGALARMIAPGSGRMGIFVTSLVGVAGGLLGNMASRALHTGGFARVLLQVATAVVLVLVLRPTRPARLKGKAHR